MTHAPSSRHPDPNAREDTPLVGWLLFPISLFPLVALMSYDWHAIDALCLPPAPSTNWVGALGDGFAYWGYTVFGLGVWTIPVLCILAGLFRITGHRLHGGWRKLWLALFLFAVSCLVQTAQPHAPGIAAALEKLNVANAGGLVGYLAVTRGLSPLLSDFGTTVVMSVLAAFSLVAAVGLRNIGAFFAGLFAWALGAPRAGNVRPTPVAPAAPSAPDAMPPHADGSCEPAEEAPAAAPSLYERIRAAREEAKRQRETEKAAAREEKERERAERERLRQEKAEAKERERLERLEAEERIRAAREAAARPKAVQPALPTLEPETPEPEPQQPDPMRVATAVAVARATTKPAAAKPPKPEPKPEPAAEEVPDKGPYVLPSLSLLKPLAPSAADHSDIGETSQRLIDTLKIFGVDATLAYTVKGPVVTKYAIQLAPGTLYTKVTNLSANLKGALHAKSLRIEAPIPGEEAIGIEVPNRKPAGISFREIFESDAWRDSKAELPLLFGKRADGKELVADLASMPHMLVAGATGQGKSVCLNSLICGLLMTRTPEQLKLIMVDPKCVEFTPYSSIPHLLVPVITDNRKVVFSLHWAVAEMEKRLKLFARARVRNIYDFNHRKSFTQTDMFGNDTEVGSDMPRTVPYIVVIIDEAADLIGQCGKEVNPDIQRITQKARAAGIHLILATQRPDAKIITGAIKANIPGRVAFKTSSGTDSRTILDDGGAENLIGRGDMLFRGKDGLLVRAQGAWISDEEIASVTGFIEEHSNVQFDQTFATKLGRVKEASIEDPFASNEDDPDNQADATSASEEKAEQRALVKAAANADDFKKAVECVINTRRASTSHFQRQMGWGYNHAAKILDMLTERGIVSPQQGMGPRQIVMDQDQLVAILNGDDAPAASAAPAPENTSADAPSEDAPAGNAPAEDVAPDEDVAHAP